MNRKGIVVGLVGIAALALAIVLSVASPPHEKADAQQSNNVTCTTTLDAGTAATCPAVLTNYQPVTAIFTETGGNEDITGTVFFQVSSDGVHFAPLDAGTNVVGAVTTFATLGGTSTQALSISDKNPWLYTECTFAALLTDGGVGTGNCYVDVLQVQTIH